MAVGESVMKEAGKTSERIFGYLLNLNFYYDHWEPDLQKYKWIYQRGICP